MDALFVWVARGLLLVLSIVFILGSGPVQQRMQTYPGKSATRLLWLAVKAPWRTQEVETDFLRQGFPNLIWLFTITLLSVGAATFFASFLLLFSVFQFLLFVVVLLLVFFVSTRINEKGAYIIAAINPSLLFVALFLALGSIYGFSSFFFLFAINPIFQYSIIIISMILLGWQFFALVIISHKAVNLTIISSVGRLLLVIGFVSMMLGVTIRTIGLELTNILFHELSILPMVFVETLEGVVGTYLMIFTPWNLSIIGGIMITMGVLLWILGYLKIRRISIPTDTPEVKG
ncbi:MAG: hypothetical protein ACFFCH_02665 [Promethearchaeota archaeon]